MADLEKRKTRLVFTTGGVVRERGKLRQVVMEAKPNYATVWLKGTRTKFDIDYAAVYGMAARKAAERARAEKLAAATVGIWFMATTETQDWLMTVTEIVPDQEYELIWRFRYHVDDKVWDSADRKSWYKALAHDTREQVIAKIRLMAEMMRAHREDSVTEPIYELLNDGDMDKFLEQFLKAPFANARVATAGEIAEFERERAAERAEQN